jgi:hypothetical protein
LFLPLARDALAQTVFCEGRHGSRDAKVVDHVKKKGGGRCRDNFAPLPFPPLNTSSREFHLQKIVERKFKQNQLTGFPTIVLPSTEFAGEDPQRVSDTSDRRLPHKDEAERKLCHLICCVCMETSSDDIADLITVRQCDLPSSSMRDTPTRTISLSTSCLGFRRDGDLDINAPGNPMFFRC